MMGIKSPKFSLKQSLFSRKIGMFSSFSSIRTPLFNTPMGIGISGSSSQNALIKDNGDYLTKEDGTILTKETQVYSNVLNSSGEPILNSVGEPILSRVA